MRIQINKFDREPQFKESEKVVYRYLMTWYCKNCKNEFFGMWTPLNLPEKVMLGNPNPARVSFPKPICPNEPTPPELKKAGLFNKKKIESQNAELTDALGYMVAFK